MIMTLRILKRMIIFFHMNPSTCFSVIDASGSTFTHFIKYFTPTSMKNFYWPNVIHNLLCEGPYAIDRSQKDYRLMLYLRKLLAPIVFLSISYHTLAYYWPIEPLTKYLEHKGSSTNVLLLDISCILTGILLAS